MTNATHTPDLASAIYDEISDAIDLLDNVTAETDNEADTLGQAELALVRARETMLGRMALIAAAPELLAALEAMLAKHDDREAGTDLWPKEAPAARAAIAKAKGE